jgi:hypothetical protein
MLQAATSLVLQAGGDVTLGIVLQIMFPVGGGEVLVRISRPASEKTSLSVRVEWPIFSRRSHSG